MTTNAVCTKTITLALTIAALAALPAWAASYNDAASGNWSAPATWGVGSGYPGSAAGDTATIDNQSRTITVDVTPANALTSLTIPGGYAGANWNLSGSSTSLDVSTLNIASYGTLGSGLTLNVLSGGSYSQNDNANYINGTLNIKSGATYGLSARISGGSGTIDVEPGATLDLAGQSLDYYVWGSLVFNNDGTVNLGSTGTYPLNAAFITGDGDWYVNSGGTLQIARSTAVMDLADATFIGNAGTLDFFQTAGGSLGEFDMGGTNTVRFVRGADYTIHRPSTFQDLTVADSFYGTLDLAPAGGGAQTHTVNGTLLYSGNESPILDASDAGGAVLNVATFNNGAVNNPVIQSGVTVNVTQGGYMWGQHFTIEGALNINAGATYTHGGGRFRGFGDINVAAGGTFAVTTGFAINYYYDPYGDGLIMFDNDGTVTVNRSGSYYHNAGVVGDGTWRVEAGTLAFGNASVAVEGFGTTFASYATWHVIAPGYINLYPYTGANYINSIGPDATIIIENNGVIEELNNSARSNLTVNGELVVLGTTNLLFNAGQGVTVSNTGTLQGNAAVSGNVSSSGTVIPGASVGTLTVNGNFSSTGTLEIELDGATADQIIVNGTVTVGGHVDVQLLGSPTAAEYVIIANDGTDAVTGAFDQQCYELDGQIYELVTDGGDGNDVALALVAGCEAHEGDFFDNLCELMAANAPTSYDALLPVAQQAADQTVTEFGLSPCCALVYVELFRVQFPAP